MHCLNWGLARFWLQGTFQVLGAHYFPGFEVEGTFPVLKLFDVQGTWLGFEVLAGWPGGCGRNFGQQP